MRELNSMFMMIPPQVVMVEMAGLQEYQHRYGVLYLPVLSIPFFSEGIVNQLNQRLLGKSLAAKVENRIKLGKSYIINW